MVESIFTLDLQKILPQSILRDEKVQAAAKALNHWLQTVSRESQLTLHLPRLDQLPSNVLDHLAAQYHCDFYKTTLPDHVKRDQIRETIFWHRIKGTPAGVEKAIADFLTDAQVEENWQYGGEPYFFRIRTKGLKYFSDEEDFLRLVYEVKNVRSWLEEIVFDLTIEEPETYFVGMDELTAEYEFTEIPLQNEAFEQCVVAPIFEAEQIFEVTDCSREIDVANKFSVAFYETHKETEI